MRRIVFIAGFLILAAAVAAMFFVPAAYLRLPLPDAKTVRVDIPKDATAATVASLLADKGLVDSGLGYRVYAVVDPTASRPKAGAYDLKDGMSYRRIARLLSIGPARDELSVRVIEGWTVRDIQKALTDLGVDAQPSDFFAERFAADYPFLKGLPSGTTLEGYLYPDTYRVFKDQLPDALIRKQLDEFSLMTSGFEGVAASQKRSLRDVLILASVIEKEAAHDAERPTIAGIFMNRLTIGMRLQSDATLNYVLRTGRDRLTGDDLATDSPYNTYANAGLPPGPISNPGKPSLDAALHPAETDYMYFLSDKDGKMYYAKTLEQHAVNRAKAFGE